MNAWPTFPLAPVIKIRRSLLGASPIVRGSACSECMFKFCLPPAGQMTRGQNQLLVADVCSQVNTLNTMRNARGDKIQPVAFRNYCSISSSGN